jgi:type II secretory pathway component PulF
MPIYAYKVKHGPGRTIEGELEAASQAEALERLERDGASPVWVREKAESGSGRKRSWRRDRRITARDVTVFTRQLASLIRSNVPILRALATIADQTGNLRFRRVVEGIEADVREGGMLSDAFARDPALFSELTVSMVRSGESAGLLDVILERLADAREAEEEVRRKVQAAMAYPLLVLAVGAATIFTLFAFFLPRVVQLFRDVRDLPLPTRLLIGTSDVFARYWAPMLIAMLSLVVVYRRLIATDAGRAVVHGLTLRIPLLGRFVRESEIARFARTLGLLIRAGIPIDRALDLGAQTLTNSVMRAEIEAVRRNTVQQGARLSEGLKRSAQFPPFVANMAAVGEEAGRLDDSLAEIATFYEREVEQQSRLATSLIEPILILGVGLIVGFIVASMLLPIFQLSTGG